NRYIHTWDSYLHTNRKLLIYRNNARKSSSSETWYDKQTRTHYYSIPYECAHVNSSTRAVPSSSPLRRPGHVSALQASDRHASHVLSPYLQRPPVHRLSPDSTCLPRPAATLHILARLN